MSSKGGARRPLVVDRLIDDRLSKSLGLQLPPFRRCLGWVPQGSNYLLRRWLES